MNPSALEGLGGPIYLDTPYCGPIDPSLDACCAREIESNRKQTALEQKLRQHDRVELIERRRRHLLTLDFGSGCRCCYDPKQDGGEYSTLTNARTARLEENETDDDENENTRKEEEEEVHNNNNDASDSDDDSDDSEFDYLLDDDSFPGSSKLSELEESRRLELEGMAMYRESLAQHGYGVHRQMHPLRVLRAAGMGMTRQVMETACVVHLYDPDSQMSASLDLMLEQEDFCRKYLGTKFLRGSGRSALLMDPALVEKECAVIHVEKDLPCLLAIRDGVLVAHCPNLQGLGSESDGTVDAHAVENWLDRAGVLKRDAPSLEDLCRIRPEEEALIDSGLLGKKEEDYYNCGVLGCEKTFYHEHVGVRNEEQDGLLVKEDGSSNPI